MILRFCGKKWSDIILESPHSHPIKHGSKEYILIKNICRLYKIKYGTDIDKIEAENTETFYQLGDIGSLRVIGLIDEPLTFYPLFLDPNHLIYPSQKHNSEDYGNYSYSMSRNISTNLSIIDFNTLPLSECFECKHLENATK